MSKKSSAAAAQPEYQYAYQGGYIEDKQPDGEVYRTPVETFGDMPARTLSQAEWDAFTAPFPRARDNDGNPTKDLAPDVVAVLDRLYRRELAPTPPTEEPIVEQLPVDTSPQEG